MDFYLLSDSHLKHEKMKTYCQRPENFTELIHKNCMQILNPNTTLIHLGDVGIGPYEDWTWMIKSWPGRKILVRGNHDRNRSISWWMDKGGFDFACDGLMFRQCWLTHEPDPCENDDGVLLNIHGHLHNIWHGFHKNAEEGSPEAETWQTQRLKHPWQRLFAVEYTNYMPVAFDKFVSHPDKYQARGPKHDTTQSNS